jgi:hypothetical protein
MSNLGLKLCIKQGMGGKDRVNRSDISLTGIV